MEREVKKSAQLFTAEMEKHIKKYVELLTDDKVEELSKKISTEQSQREIEDLSMCQMFNAFAEQTSSVLEAESSRMWEAIQSHSLDVSPSSSPSGQSAFSKGQRKIQLNNSPRFSSIGRQTPTPTTFSGSPRSLPPVMGETIIDMKPHTQVHFQSQQVKQPGFSNNINTGFLYNGSKLNPHMR